ncbi:fluoride efflux transporter CrcB [Deinococcus aerophilus]|uniref:Fluoride-specific ion channel FluC n=1 Tax=Deinococcus aerophilus TaxID=522488 RepID=A0ABQ2GU84_9DEIO|nr:fluoride efflux transporter CrcB [Deinococcus aerophilus]GGM13639.1 putative fluoride ion transporter CrcB [Deinococcus aerophilus]
MTGALWLWVMLGGAVGAACRQGVVLLLAPLVVRSGFPVAVLLINVLGSFLLGLTLALAGRGMVPEAARLAFGTGVLGAFTTFSTFSSELDVLLLRGQVAPALTYAAASVGLGLTAAVAGRLLGTRL